MKYLRCNLAAEAMYYYPFVSSQAATTFVGQVVNLRPIGGALWALPAGSAYDADQRQRCLRLAAVWGRLSTCGRLVIGLLCLVAALASSCGYHVSGNTIPNVPPAAGKAGATLPLNIKTIAIPAFTTNQARPKLTRLLATNITQEFLSRTKYDIIADPNQADAVLKGSLSNFVVYQTISDPVTGRATGATIIVTVQITLTERSTGKVLFSRPSQEYRERYEISTDPQTYFDESGTAVQRVARDVARDVVTSILENF